MELEVEKQDKNSVVIKVRGETHTLLNMVREELWNDKNVSEASVVQEHPFAPDSKILVKVSSGSPISALEKSADRVSSNVEKLKKAFDKAF